MLGTRPAVQRRVSGKVTPVLYRRRPSDSASLCRRWSHIIVALVSAPGMLAAPRPIGRRNNPAHAP
jgi:hypothetical protein